jgi:hypothetical protein
MVPHLHQRRVNTMAKKVNTPVEVTENTITSPYGDLMIAPPTQETKKKEEVRDYKKTSEVLEILSKYNSKSEAIRALHKQGMKKGEIADLLRIRYQHVHNVLNQILKRS